MSSQPCYCINPHCKQADHPNNNDPNTRFCQICGSELLLNGQFRVSRLLSQNTGFGYIYEAFKGFSASILKVLKPEWNNQPKAIDLFKREYEVLAELRNQGVTGIPKVESFFEYQTREGLILYCLVMEKVEGIDLEQWVNNNGKINQNQALKWLRDIVLILDKIHAQNYFHRDLKPANIMMRNNGELVLIDFGTAREETQTYFQSLQGQRVTGISTAGYTPREQEYGQAVIQSDFFALGRTFVHLLTGKHPVDLYDNLNDELVWEKEIENINQYVLTLVNMLMARIPKDRPENTQKILALIDFVEEKIKLEDSFGIENSLTPQLSNDIKISIDKTQQIPLEKKLEKKFNLIVCKFISTFTLIFILITGWNIFIKGIQTRVSELDKEGIQIIGFAQMIGGASLWLFGIPISIAIGMTGSGISLSKKFAFSPDHKYFASYDNNKNNVDIWEVKTGNKIKILEGHTGVITSVNWSTDGNYLVTGGQDQTIFLWKITEDLSMKRIRTIKRYNYNSPIIFSPDNNYIASVTVDNKIRIWSLLKWDKIITFDGHSQIINDLTWSPNGIFLASISHDCTAKIWKIDTKELILTITKNENSKHYTAISWSPNGKYLALGNDTNNILIWDLVQEKVTKTFQGHFSTVNCFIWSQNSQFLISGSSDTIVKVWDVENEKLVYNISGHSDQVLSVAFNSDGKVLATASQNGEIKFWRIDY